MRKLSLFYLSSTLSLLLTILQSLSVHTKKITTEGFDPAESLEILETDHEVPREVGRAILEFFGERVGTEGEIWTLKVGDVVREIGLATLSGLKVTHFVYSIESIRAYQNPHTLGIANDFLHLVCGRYGKEETDRSSRRLD
jgi:hypothetical protein